MSERKLCGYDLNGWRDRAARNWLIGADGEEESGPDHVVVSGSVLRSAVVRIGNDEAPRWIGGAQAALAPHGRGGGWGNVGHLDRRLTTLSLLSSDDAPAARLAAALTGLSAGSKVCAISIDDHPARSEYLQERLLTAVAKGRLGRGLLVWRSVLAVLGSLTEDNPPFAPRDGVVIGVVGHVAEGFTVQRLRLRKESGRRRVLFAPERRQAAQPFASRLGYEGLFERACSAFEAGNSLQLRDWAGNTHGAIALALGDATSDELLRNERGDFLLVRPPDHFVLGPSDLPEEVAASLEGCDVVLFETLTVNQPRQTVLETLQRLLPVTLVCLDEDIVARGALEAARRHATGEPVYFDFLPQISTIVLGQNGATNYDLIGTEETLPAGRVYRSPRPANFAIQAGQSEFSVHLRKELAQWPRKARVDVGTAVSEIVPVALSVEQVPAAGRARLIVDAPMLSRQFHIDWEAATELQQPWEEIIAELGTSSATIPKRLVLPCGMDAWDDYNQSPGLATLLSENDGRENVDWKSLASKLVSRPKKRYCISSDGNLPPAVSEELRSRLDRLTERALQHIRARSAGRIQDDNETLKFLTWQFRRAPAEVPRMLLEAWEARSPLFRHPFVTHHSSWVLIYQGFGRTCRTAEHEKDAFAKLFQRRISEWSYRQETAAAAFLLSRSDTAPLLLERADVERLVARVLFEFNEEIGSEYTKFNYAPFLLGGLLRWRLKVRNALVVGQDPLADKLRAAILKTLIDFGRRRRMTPTFQRAVARYEPLLKQLLDELDGQGGNPDLLLDLYDL
jgi:hypothetical protein